MKPKTIQYADMRISQISFTKSFLLVQRQNEMQCVFSKFLKLLTKFHCYIKKLKTILEFRQILFFFFNSVLDIFLYYKEIKRERFSFQGNYFPLESFVQNGGVILFFLYIKSAERDNTI